MPEPLQVLIVDDDNAIRMAVGLLLTDEGYTVLEAADGELALQLAAAHRPDLILLDMRMPGMDGREFMRRYRAGPGPHAPVIVFTAGRVPPAGLPDFQADGFLAKPFELDDLLALIDQHLAHARDDHPPGRAVG